MQETTLNTFEVHIFGYSFLCNMVSIIESAKGAIISNERVPPGANKIIFEGDLELAEKVQKIAWASQKGFQANTNCEKIFDRLKSYIERSCIVTGMLGDLGNSTGPRTILFRGANENDIVVLYEIAEGKASILPAREHGSRAGRVPSVNKFCHSCKLEECNC